MARRIIFASGHIEWYEGQLRALLASPAGETSQEIRRRAVAVQKRAKRAAPKGETGELSREIHVSMRYPATGAVATISADAPHASVVEFGRGRIVPVRANRLWWEGMASPVGALSVRAVPATNFMRDSLDAAKDR